MAELTMGIEELGEEEAADLEAIRRRKKEVVAAHRIRKAAAGNRSVVPAKHSKQGERTTARMRESLGALGIDTGAAEARARSESRGRKRTRSLSAAAERRGGGGGDADMADADGGDDAQPRKRIHSSKSRSMSRGRALSVAAPSPSSGLKDAAQRNKATKMGDRAQRLRNKAARIGEADRVITTKMPKHLFSGKTGRGKRDRR
ncbi:hypothetical protein MNEG_11197 [Monoraphidium neglectum]|uniref:Nucleolar GTP-binding protein 1 n=1 Tax=Monoraphidium neglectum TaxID=145388 RepID=A0A0D2KLZ9_9CHLO|nr:hypothetical protein MNEG_11197 [Monoraphidium neglectum]KIY96763.1 hypothetical protein MNEG_11197 [Monoraphidium neglectum]|eukprot:XP_013895783.1 hypothetical protein MNEG_11197 [Monoraphidium neglectum]